MRNALLRFAIKVIEKAKHQWRDFLQAEQEIMRRVDHPNCVKTLQAINDEGMRPFRHVASGGAVVPHIRGSGV